MISDTRLKRVLRAIERGLPVPSQGAETGRLEEALSKVPPWDSQGVSGWQSTCLGTFAATSEELTELDQIVTRAQEAGVLGFSDVHVPSTYESDLLHLDLLKNKSGEYYLVVVYDPVEPFADGKVMRKVRLGEVPFTREELARLLEEFPWQTLRPQSRSSGGICRRIRDVLLVFQRSVLRRGERGSK